MRRFLLIILGILVVLIVIGVRVLRRPATIDPIDAQHVLIEIPTGRSYGGSATGRQLDIAPDGTKIVYVGTELDERQLYLQGIDKSAATAIAGTEHGADPSFSHDGRRIAFYADGIVKVVALDGGAVTSVGKVTPPRGIAWLDDKTLIVGNVGGNLLRLNIENGESQPLNSTSPPPLAHLAPYVLPRKDAVLFTLANGPLTKARLGIVSIESGVERPLFDENAFAPRYAPTGHLVFARGFGRELAAVKFDLKTLEVVGSPAAVLQIPLSGRGTGGSTDYAFSDNGTLVYTTRRDEGLDDVLAGLGNVDLTEIHVQLNWFDELKRRLP